MNRAHPVAAFRKLVPVLGVMLWLAASPAAQDKPVLHDLQPRFDAGFVYRSTDTEKIDTALRFDIKLSDGIKTVNGGVTDTSSFTITRQALAHEAGLLTRLRVTFENHSLVQSRLKPGESASEQTYNGQGPFHGAAYTQEWLKDRWVRRLEVAATSRFGERPDELAKELAVQHTTRGHPLLPDKPVAVGDKWRPDTGELKRRLERFAQWPAEAKPEVEAEAKLVSVEGDTAVVSIELSAKGLQPAKTDAMGEWRKGATVDVTFKATLKLDLKLGFVQSSESTIEAKINGEMRVSGQWATVTGTLKLHAASVTERQAAKD